MIYSSYTGISAHRKEVFAVKKWLACALLLLICLLSGCRYTNTLNDQLALVADTVNANDAEAFVSLFYPGIIPEESLLTFFEQIHSYGQTMDISEAKMFSFNYKSAASAGHREISHSGTYLLYMDQSLCQFSLQYVEADGVAGLVSMHINKLADTPLPLSLVWGLSIALLIAAFGLLIITIVDICRKKPRRYALWILLCLLFYIRCSILGIRFPLLLGVILYWCLRKTLLRRKAKAAARQASAEDMPADHVTTDTVSTGDAPAEDASSGNAPEA